MSEAQAGRPLPSAPRKTTQDGRGEQSPLTLRKPPHSLPDTGAKLAAQPGQHAVWHAMNDVPLARLSRAEESMMAVPFMTTAQVEALRQERSRSDWMIAAGTLLAVVVAMMALLVPPARSQEAEPVIYPGAMAVTGFPGTTIPGLENGLPPGVDPVDETLIDQEQPSLRVHDVRALGGPAGGQLIYPPEPFTVKDRDIGLVFGLTFDDGLRDGVPTGIPDLYAAATSLFGIHIVTPDEDGDGRPERQRSGQAGAVMQDGQWGQALAGGPGTIYRIDGRSGLPSVFATIDGNSGPGLGDIAFDRAHRQFFVSDLDTGMIHRIAADGIVLDHFDHGVDGRPAHGHAPISDDGSVMDITGPSFDSEDPGSWGLTAIDRRVHAVTVHGGRLWYAVGAKAEIWSIGINRDGTLAADPRWELDVAADRDLAVTDMVFDAHGFLYLAQRGETANRYDYSRFAETGDAVVLRYWRENPDDPATESVWVPVPQEYAVGFPEPNRQTDGGIDLQYGYDANGYVSQAACTDTIAKTGDDLRNNPALSDQLAAGGPFNVHGVQLTALTLVKPANVPPFGAWFLDNDGLFDDPELKGHVGDVEIWHPCEGRAGWYDPYYPPSIPPVASPCVELTDLAYFCAPGGLEADLTLKDKTGYGFDSLKSTPITPGVSVSPPMQTVPPGAPYTLGLSGHVPGQIVDLNLCFYKDADAKKGGYFPCCTVTLPLPTPDVSCEP